jgi:hypothetical protein
VLTLDAAARGRLAQEAGRVDAGRGYDRFKDSERSTALSLADSDVVYDGQAQDVLFDMKRVTSSHDLEKFLEINAAASYSGFGVSADAKASWASRQRINSFRVYLATKCKVINAKTRLVRTVLREDLVARLKSGDLTLRGFYNTYGDQFIATVLTGGEFIVLYEFNTTTAEEQQKLSVALEGSYGGFQASGSFSSKLESLTSNISVSATVHINGGADAVPEIKPETLLKAVREFPNKVNPHKEGGWPAVIGWSTADYYRAEGFPAETDLPFDTNYRILLTLAEKVATVQVRLRDIEYIREQAHLFRELNDAQWASLEKNLDELRDFDQTLKEELWKLQGDPAKTYTLPAKLDLRKIQKDIDAIGKKLPERRARLDPRTGKGPFVIKSVLNESLVVDIKRNNRDKGTGIWTWDLHGGDNQRWRFEKQPDDGSYVIKSELNGLVLDVQRESRSAGTPVIMWDRHNGSNQRWFLEQQTDDGSFIIRSKLNSMVLDIARVSSQKEAEIWMWDYHGGANQRWRIEPVS